jgi:hypothetical protein
MIHLMPARDQSSELARSILREWCQGNKPRFRSKLDRALKSIAATPADTTLHEERQELLEGVTRELLQASAGPLTGSGMESIATCIALLTHISSSGDEPPQASFRAQD